jgi:hypothetical protein
MWSKSWGKNHHVGKKKYKAHFSIIQY